MNNGAEEIRNVESEAGIVASIILKPELIFYSEALTPHHFTDKSNGYMYYAISELAKKGVEHIDAYNIVNILNNKAATRHYVESTLTIPLISDFIDNASLIARSTPEDYQILVTNVLDAAFRRNTFNKLIECERLCINTNEKNIEQKIYSALDEVMMEYSSANDIPLYKDIIDDIWSEIKSRQHDGAAGIPFKFPTLNNYVTIERGELVVFCAPAKTGKSMMLLNCAVDLLKQNRSVLYIDSELNTRMFTCRLLSHLTGIEFNRLRDGRYTKDEEARIEHEIQWIKTRRFTHLYMPIFDPQSIYIAAKKAKHTQDLDVLIVDYFKGSGAEDAFASYAELGRLVDMVKNDIAGSMNIAALGAAQATVTGKVADSARIGRNASTIIVIQDKTPEEIEMDGVECGNKKLRIVLNRNGAQMQPDQYIDLAFDGNVARYTEVQQHVAQTPY